MAITIDKKAASKLHQFREEGENYLRVSIVGGGCSGFQYRLVFDKPGEKDHVFESNGEKIITDDVSLGFIDGSEITYIDNLNEAGFQVKNPNITGSCGCGSSFYTD